MIHETLAYRSPGTPAPKPQPRPECVRRRRRVCWTVATVGLVVFYVLYLGDNRWRVRYHHAVKVPSSARDFRCSGLTAFPGNLLDGGSRAEFTIDRADLPRFLGQFQPRSGPGPILAAHDGEEWCASPTGRDYAWVVWHTTPDGVSVDVRTSFN